jgi:hypothetical protein
MELIIRTAEGTGADLYGWLLEDPDLPRDASVTPSADGAAAGEMGLAFDVLNLVLPNSIALGTLVVSIVTYRAAQRDRTGTAPQISVGHADMFVAVQGDGSEVLRRLLPPEESP